MSGAVYFMRPIGQLGPVKIGHSRWPEERLKQCMAWSPIALEIVAQIPGTQRLERRFHARFAHLHSHHEWFLSAPDLLAAIDQINAGAFDPESLPHGVTLRSAEARAESRAWSRAIGRLNGMRKRGFHVPAEIWDAAHQWGLPATEKVAKRAAIMAFVDEHYESPQRAA